MRTGLTLLAAFALFCWWKLGIEAMVPVAIFLAVAAVAWRAIAYASRPRPIRQARRRRNWPGLLVGLTTHGPMAGLIWRRRR
jgi:hypothetical protein